MENLGLPYRPDVQQGIQIYNSPSHTAFLKTISLLEGRDALTLGVDELADVVSRHVKTVIPITSPFYTDCSEAAKEAFKLLTGTELASMKFSSLTSTPLTTSIEPMITVVSLTGSDKPLDTASGHRFIMLHSKHRVRLLQAYKGKCCFSYNASVNKLSMIEKLKSLTDQCSLGDFMRHPDFKHSWSKLDFDDWWKQLKDAIKPETQDRASALGKLIGVDCNDLGSTANCCFINHPISLSL